MLQLLLLHVSRNHFRAGDPQVEVPLDEQGAIGVRLLKIKTFIRFMPGKLNYPEALKYKNAVVQFKYVRIERSLPL